MHTQCACCGLCISMRAGLAQARLEGKQHSAAGTAAGCQQPSSTPLLLRGSITQPCCASTLRLQITHLLLSRMRAKKLRGCFVYTSSGGPLLSSIFSVAVCLSAHVCMCNWLPTLLAENRATMAAQQGWEWHRLGLRA